MIKKTNKSITEAKLIQQSIILVTNIQYYEIDTVSC